MVVVPWDWAHYWNADTNVGHPSRPPRQLRSIRPAPGINLAAEYLYVQKHQGGCDTGGANATTTPVGNGIHAQGLTFATW
jgi:hypothetical protein